MTGKERFKQGLIELGYEVTDHGSNRLSIPFEIEGGNFNGQSVVVGLEVPADFDLSPPHGPHMKPRLLPVNTRTSDPKTRMHESGFGPEWGHLSRPIPNWNKTNRSVKEYIRWVRYVFASL